MSSDPPAPPQDQQDQVEFPPEAVEALVRAIDNARARQRIMLVGYALALFVAVVGLLGAFWLFGRLPETSFRVWVFLAPLGFVGTILWFFGWLAKRRHPPKTT